jgi:hypothetical protein
MHTYVNGATMSTTCSLTGYIVHTVLSTCCKGVYNTLSKPHDTFIPPSQITGRIPPPPEFPPVAILNLTGAEIQTRQQLIATHLFKPGGGGGNTSNHCNYPPPHLNTIILMLYKDELHQK